MALCSAPPVLRTPVPGSCSDADPARPVSDAEEAATARWTVTGHFGRDVGLDRIRDERGRGSDWESPPPERRGLIHLQHGGGPRLSRLRLLRSRSW